MFNGFAEARWPKPADPEGAERELARFAEAAGELEAKAERAAALKLARSAAGKRLLRACFGNSPFLSQLLVGDVAFAVDLLRSGPEEACARVTAEAAALERPESTTALMAGLRRAKRRLALAIALADISGVWSLERVTAALSDLAELTLGLAARHALREAAASGELALPDPERPDVGSGLVVIGMGKLGSRELNYSSDIDLIVLYDDERIATDRPDALQKTFVRVARNLVRLMEERTHDGYVFRTDLRLRPDPGSTPLALSVSAAEVYYESFGQNWERAAMIKARPVAGDREAGAAFVAALRPYVWRKHLDFAAIQDIHSIKRQINAHRGGGEIAVAGHNIKIGRGGIREIEFFAQTQQLIWGGRVPELRVAATVPALRALAAAGRIDPATADGLTEAYQFLRRVEHRLQMIDDQQTQTLPQEGADLERLAIFLGFADAEAFSRVLVERLRRVERYYAELFEEAPSLAGPGNLVFTGTDEDPGTLETLTKLGFQEPARASATVRGWHHGRYRAMRSARARELLTELTPSLLNALARTPQPDAAFLAFDRFLGRLPAGVQLFSLFQQNPGLLDLVAEIMGGAPRLAELLSTRPQLLDSVLAAGFLDPPPPLDALCRELSRTLEHARDFQDVLDVTRRFAHERRFQIGVQMLRGLASVERTGAALADVAEAVLAALLPAVESEFARLHGRVPGGSFAIVALGKLGGREMTATSDLDLVFLYDVPAGAELSDGDKPLPASQYYARLANRYVNAVTALTPEGELYEIDLRLRPSGSKGPLAAQVEGFAAYHRGEAWTWEHMALTRARTIAGPDRLRARIEDELSAILALPRDPARLAADVAAMRALMARENPPRGRWDVKLRRGGLVDVEFIVQYLQLRHVRAHPAVRSTNTATSLQRALAAGLIGAEEGATLAAALQLWQSLQGLLRLTVEGEFEPESAPTSLKSALARAAGVPDFAALERLADATAERVATIFARLLPAVESEQVAPSAASG